MPYENYPNLALSFQVFNHLNQPVLFNWIFDYEKNICRKKGKNYLRFTYEELGLYKGSYFIRVHLAESKTRKKFQEIDCCHFTVEMINLKEPEWGWTEGVSQFLYPGKWEQE
jgi:lipopolysaccharide transport system ATP-binding protein